MVSVEAESIGCTIIVTVICIFILSLLIYFIRAVNKHNVMVDKYVKYYFLLSISCSLCRSFGILIMYITVLSTGNNDVITQNTEKISIFFHGLAYTFQATVYIRRLQVAFKNSMFGYSNCVIYSLYFYLLFMIIVTFIAGIMRFVFDNEKVSRFDIIYAILGRTLEIIVLFLFCRKLLILMIASCKMNLKQENSVISASSTPTVYDSDVDIYDITSKSNKNNCNNFKASNSIDREILECMSKWVTTYFIAFFVAVITGALARKIVENELFVSNSANAICNLINVYCLFLTFKFASKQYEILCKYANNCCVSCCLCCVLCQVTDKKLNMNVVRLMVYYSGGKGKNKVKECVADSPITGKLELSKISQSPQIELESNYK